VIKTLKKIKGHRECTSENLKFAVSDAILSVLLKYDNASRDKISRPSQCGSTMGLDGILHCNKKKVWERVRFNAMLTRKWYPGSEEDKQ
jgi:hypothetical protein